NSWRRLRFEPPEPARACSGGGGGCGTAVGGGVELCAPAPGRGEDIVATGGASTEVRHQADSWKLLLLGMAHTPGKFRCREGGVVRSPPCLCGRTRRLVRPIRSPFPP